VLSVFVMDHVRVVVREVFPEVKRSELDLDALAVALRARKAELMARGTGRAKGGSSKAGKPASRKSANGARVPASPAAQ
jgi:hypothetical protein